MRLARFKTLRILMLLAVLCVTAGVTAYQHYSSRSWSRPLQVSIYPVNGDGATATTAYIDTLAPADFSIVNRWAAREAARHGLALTEPFQISLAAPVEHLPPELAAHATALQTALWSLRFRWWAFRNTAAGDLTEVRIFVRYQQGQPGKALAHSLGMAKGLLGLVHAFADEQQHQQNLIVITHELLHTVGAVDKYAADGSPLWPQGYADPDADPRRVQPQAEIMAGRRIGPHGLVMADSLQHVRLNEWTAREINWVD